MKTILVTGGAGFIGSCFVRETRESDAVRVVNVDALTYAEVIANRFRQADVGADDSLMSFSGVLRGENAI